MNSSRINSIFHFTLIFTVLFIVILLCFSRPVKANTDIFNNYYSTLLQVIKVEYNEELNTGYAILSTDDHIIKGFQYITYNPSYIWDMWEGDFYAAIMYNNGTEQIIDDSIVELHYVRPDLF